MNIKNIITCPNCKHNFNINDNIEGLDDYVNKKAEKIANEKINNEKLKLHQKIEAENSDKIDKKFSNMMDEIKLLKKENHDLKSNFQEEIVKSKNKVLEDFLKDSENKTNHITKLENEI